MSESDLESSEENEMLSDGESVKEDVVLGADSETVSDLIHVSTNVIAIYDRRSSRGCVQTWGGGGGGVAQEKIKEERKISGKIRRKK